LFYTACHSASITSVVSKWRPLSFIFNRETEKSGVGGGDSHIVMVKNSLVKKEV
jgi:hypothetical protein